MEPGKASRPSPMHPDSSGMRARFPTEQDSTFSCYRPNKDTDINGSWVSWAAHEMIREGEYVRTLFLPPSQSPCLPSTRRRHHSRHIHYGFLGSTKPKIIYGVLSPFNSSKQTLGSVANPCPKHQDHLCHCIQKKTFMGINPGLPIGSTPDGDLSGLEGSISLTFTSLESLNREIDLLKITIWILASDFLRFQLLEPIVGDTPMSYPSIVDEYGLKGQSIYTAFFDHLDMKTFVCWRCDHTVAALEAAIAYQRAMHFQNRSYQCQALSDQW